MSLPGFSADACLRSARRPYRALGPGGPKSAIVVPAIPFCGNCDEILDRCSRNGFRPRAVCRACLVGNCFSGVEDPTPHDPFTPLPGQAFPGL